MTSEMVSIHAPHGLNIRPAGEIAEHALGFRCSIIFERADMQVSAKSLLGLLSLGIDRDTDLKLICDGMDEDKALESMKAFLIRLNEKMDQE